MASEEKNLAQPGDKMFERNTAITAMNSRELKVQMVNGYTVTGYIAGMDDENLQICRTSDAKYSILNRAQILTYEETGQTIKEVKPDERREEITSHISHFVKVAKAFHTNESRPQD